MKYSNLSSKTTHSNGKLNIIYNLDMNNKVITSLDTPVNPFDAANKYYVDNAVSNISSGALLPNSVFTNISSGTISTNAFSALSGTVPNVVFTNVSSGTISTNAFSALSGTVPNVVFTNVSSGTISCDNGFFTHLTGLPYIAIFEERQPSGVPAGSAVVGYQIRSLNTSVYNTISGVILNTSSNIMTIPLGIYHIKASSPTYSATHNRVRLYNISDSTGSLLGTASWSQNSQTDSVIDDILTLNSAKNFRLDHYCDGGHSTNGLGQPSNSGEIEIYSKITIIKYN